MKRLNNKKLAVYTAAAFGMNIFVILMAMGYIPIIESLPGLKSFMAMTFHIVPVFMLQVLLCRLGKWVKWGPSVLLLAASYGCFMGYAHSTGWDTLGWFILLIMCVPASLGIIAGFIYYKFAENRKAAGK